MLPLSIKSRIRTNFFNKLPLWFLSFLLIILFIFSLQYLKIEIFFKQANTPFEGNYFYNPYKDFSLNTVKANFHTHSKSGRNSIKNPNETGKIYEHYKRNGYDIISVSNYQKIEKDTLTSLYIPVYEHGYNINKSHQLIIDSEKPVFYDFSLIQNYSTRQQVINKLNQRRGLIVLAHPSLFGGYKESDMKYLKGYDFIEVFNNYAVSDNIWDAALTNGYPAWLMANDDCHDISLSNLSFNNWTRISSHGNSKEEILMAMKEGCHYGVRNLDHTELNYLDSCIVTGDVLKVYFRNEADRIKFISDNGTVIKEAVNTNFASYKIEKENSYVRVEAHNGEELIYLNPVIRYNGYQLSYNNGFPLIDSTLTILVRMLIFCLNLSLLFIILAINGRVAIPVILIKFPTRFRTRGEMSLG